MASWQDFALQRCRWTVMDLYANYMSTSFDYMSKRFSGACNCCYALLKMKARQYHVSRDQLKSWIWATECYRMGTTCPAYWGCSPRRAAKQPVPLRHKPTDGARHATDTLDMSKVMLHLATNNSEGTSHASQNNGTSSASPFSEIIIQFLDAKRLISNSVPATSPGLGLESTLPRSATNSFLVNRLIFSKDFNPFQKWFACLSLDIFGRHFLRPFMRSCNKPP